MNNKFNSENDPMRSIVAEVKKAGIKVNNFLERLILENDLVTIQNALAAVYQYRSRTFVYNPEGLFVEALRGRWKPNRSSRIR